jgi:tetraacyldisaccharide 4'-kinase
MSIEVWLTQRWYSSAKPPLLLRLVSKLYEKLLAFDQRKRLKRPDQIFRARVPVIVIGNFTAGGTGKTPLSIALVQQLKSGGYQPGVVTRGYGRKNKQAVSVDEQSITKDVGDEPRLIFQRTQVPVRVDSHRSSAAKYLLDQGCDVIVADDGLQHWKLARDIEIEVVDEERYYGNGYLLPAGPLREEPRKTDLRVINTREPRDIALDAYQMRLSVTDVLNPHSGQRLRLDEFAGRTVHAVAGIGNPSRFFSSLKSAGLNVIEHPKPDHHLLQIGELNFSDEHPVFITEKDAVKIDAKANSKIHVVEVSAQLPAEFWQQLNLLLEQAEQKHKLPA